MDFTLPTNYVLHKLRNYYKRDPGNRFNLEILRDFRNMSHTMELNLG